MRFELTPDARRFESWEISCALVLGLGAAARYALDVGIETARDRARALAAYARARLAEVPGRAGARSRARSSAPSSPSSRPAAAARRSSSRSGREGSTPARRTGTDAVIDMDEKGARSAIRISPHYYNTGGGDRRRGRGAGGVARIELGRSRSPDALPPSLCSTGSSTGHTVSATRRCPAAVGWSMSAWLSESTPATPSSRNGTSGTPLRLASSGYTALNRRA